MSKEDVFLKKLSFSMKFFFFLMVISLFYYQVKSQNKTQEEITYDSILKIKQNCIGKNFSNFNARDLSGNFLSNKNFENKVTFVNFWFENCKPCIEEFEALNLLCKTYFNNKKFQFISFTFDQEMKAKQTVEKYDLKFIVIPVSNLTCYELNCMNGFPTNMIVNGKGEIKLINVGGFKNVSDFNEKILPKLDELLKGEKIK